jgi:hypothetical protein
MRMSHPGLTDPAHPERWLVEPNSRKFRSHVERFDVDAAYREQCLAAEPPFTNDGHLWFHGRCSTTGKYMYLDAVELAAKPNDGDPRGSLHTSANRGMYRGAPKAASQYGPGRARRGDNMKRDLPAAVNEITGKGGRKGASKSSSSSSWDRY